MGKQVHCSFDRNCGVLTIIIYLVYHNSCQITLRIVMRIMWLQWWPSTCGAIG